MRNARRMDEHITIGRVPDREDLSQLRDLGYRTVLDVRETEERFNGGVERRARELGLIYESIPVRRDRIEISDVKSFFRIVHDPDRVPIYVFSRFGKKPLAFLLLFEVVARGESMGKLFLRASRLGVDLKGDLALQSFLVDFYNRGNIDEIRSLVQQLRPDLIEDSHESCKLPRSTSQVPVTRDERVRHLGQKGAVVWLTGLPCAGKSTTAFALERALHTMGLQGYVLDSDCIRAGLCSDLGFSRKDRCENSRRIAHVARILADAGIVVITSFISPNRKDRQAARDVMIDAQIAFFEVFVDTPPELCDHRDRRGLYQRARSGSIENFTGVSSSYDVPEEPDLVIRPAQSSPSSIAWQILALLRDSDVLCMRPRENPSGASRELS